VTGETVSLAEAARRCGVTPTTVRRWVRDGKLPGAVEVVGTGYSIPVAELAAYAKPLAVAETSTALTTQVVQGGSLDIAVMRAELDALRGDLAAAHAREVESLRTLNADLRRERDELLSMLDRMTRALPAGADSTSTASTTRTPRRRWWNRQQ